MGMFKRIAAARMLSSSKEESEARGFQGFRELKILLTYSSFDLPGFGLLANTYTLNLTRV